MLPFAFEVNNLFPFRETLFHRGASRFSSIARSVYAPLRFRSQPFFSFPRKLIRLRFREPFSLVAKGEIALKQPLCQPTSAIIFKTIQSICVNPL